MSIADIKKNAEQKMLKSIEAFKVELSKIRTGRAHPGILDQVQVEYYGSLVPISQVANVTLQDARTISVQPWEKGMGAKIEKAIRESDLGLNPASQGLGCAAITAPSPGVSACLRVLTPISLPWLSIAISNSIAASYPVTRLRSTTARGIPLRVAR